MSPTRRWPPAPLVTAAGESLRQTAAMLGVDPAVLCRPLTDRQADRFTLRLGLLPEDVWGIDWFEDPHTKETNDDT